jgi:hypothetical protein
VHLEVSILAQHFNRHKNSAFRLRNAKFRTAIRAASPRIGDGGGNFGPRCAAAQKLPQVLAMLRVKAQIPKAVCGETAAVATPAERRRRGGDNSEYCTVG